MSSIKTPPTPRTKKPATTPVAPSDAAGAPQTATVDLAAIRNEAAMMDAELAQQEAALRERIAEISERRQNASRAKALLAAATSREKADAARAAADAERADAQARYNADVAALNRLLARAQEQTAALAQTVGEALAADSRRYSASLALGISQQRSGFAKRALTAHLGYKLHTAGLTDFPYGRTNRTLTDDPQGDGGAV